MLGIASQDICHTSFLPSHELSKNRQVKKSIEEFPGKVLQLTSDLQEHLFISDEICRCLEAVASEDLPQVTKEAFEVGSSNQHSEQHDCNNLSYN